MEKMRTINDVTNISLLDCVNKLADLNDSRTDVSIQYGIQSLSFYKRRKQLKLYIYNALFIRDVRKRHGCKSFLWKLLTENNWDAELVCSVIAFRLCCMQQQFLMSEKLLQLFDKIYQEQDGKYIPLLQVLLYLSKTLCGEKYKHNPVSRIFLPRKDTGAILDGNAALQYGDDRCSVFLQSYQSYPAWIFRLGEVERPPELSPYGSLAICNVTCEMRSKSLEKYQNLLKTLRPKSGLLKGLPSQLFSQPGDPRDPFTKQSWQSLYGSLLHSRVTSTNASLQLPSIPPAKQLDLCCHLPMAADKSSVPSGSLKENSVDEDEGFVSRGSSPSAMSPVSSSKFSETQSEAQGNFYEDDEPYMGYRSPRYDLNAWDECMKVQRSNHRTWETLGLPAGSTQPQYYLTEAGSAVFDMVWKQRWQIVVELATAICRESRAPGLRPPPTYRWIVVEEDVLVQHAVLVSVGVVSKTFHFNTLARMFLPSKKVHIAGVTAPSTASLLSFFAEWGTCYWRLLRFTSAGLASSAVTNYKSMGRGVIFKAFCDGIRSYLHQYQRNLLNASRQVTSLQQLAVVFRKPGQQISYLTRLCKCGSPDSPLEHLATATHPDFPAGIGILSYIYEEAVHCTQTSDYLVLLYLLRKCCQPYLQFVQNWVFRGSCWDLTGEFMLRVNPKNHGRRDRRRWTSYIEAAAPDDVKSCVPSFLSPVAMDILTSGKTIELMQLVCPEHFLCTQPVPLPALLLTFSMRRMQELVFRWRSFESSVGQLERERTVFWEKKEEDLKTARREKIRRAREAYEEQLREFRLRQRRILEKERQMKSEELLRLKKQAEDELERKQQMRLNEKKEDARRLREVEEREEEQRRREEKLLQEAKEEMISHYEQLNQEAERRRTRAEWKIKRHNLQPQRLKMMRLQTWSSEEERTGEEPGEDTGSDHGTREKPKLVDSPPPQSTSEAAAAAHNSSSEDACAQTDAPPLSRKNPVGRPEVPDPSGSIATQEVVDSATTRPDAFSESQLDAQPGGRAPSADDNSPPLFTPQDRGPLDEPDDEPSVSRETVQAEQPAVTDVIARAKNLAQQSVPGRHASQSSIQNLMYHQSATEDDGRLSRRAQTSVEDLVTKPTSSAVDQRDSKPEKRGPRPHVSDSTVQLIMYPELGSKTTEGDSDVAFRDSTAFQLQLPPCDPYDDGAILKKLNSQRSGVLLSSVDLYGAVVSDAFGNYGDDGDGDEDVLGHSGDSITMDLHALPILLRNCVLRPIKAHTALVNRCAVNYFMADLDLPRHFEALRHFLLLEDGEFAQSLCSELFEMVHSGCAPSSVLNPISLGSVLSRAVTTSGQSKNQLASNLGINLKHLPLAFDQADLNVLDCIELRYSVGWPCNIVLSESCHNKYNLVLSFLLKLKLVVWSLHDACSRLNRIVSGHPIAARLTASDSRKLYIYMHEMQNFVKVMQGYVSTQVLHVCWTEFHESLRNKVETLEDLHLRHAEYVNRCVLRCLLTPKAQNVMNVIGDVLKCILRFRNQLATGVASFSSLHRTYLEFTRYSNFLYRVVTKLVERGYQPHLEDFLIRLNFNGYYKT